MSDTVVLDYEFHFTNGECRTLTVVEGTDTVERLGSGYRISTVVNQDDQITAVDTIYADHLTRVREVRRVLKNYP
jgi:hypothetical protein